MSEKHNFILSDATFGTLDPIYMHIVPMYLQVLQRAVPHWPPKIFYGITLGITTNV